MIKIIVVDDELHNLREIELAINQSGLKVTAYYFDDPVQALAKAQLEYFHVALLDIQMPGMTGIELAEKLSAINPQIGTVFLTAYNNYAAQAFEVNAVDYILKPLRQERIEKMLHSFFSKEFVKKEKLKSGALSIYSFGDQKVFCGEEEIRWNRRKEEELFWLLLTNKERQMHKEVICEMMWNRYSLDRALPNLHVTISRLRKILSCFGREQIKIDYYNDYYSLSLGSCFFDADLFSAAIESNKKELLEKALSFYNGRYLASQGWLWAEAIREQYHKKYYAAVSSLIGKYKESQEYSKIETSLEKCLGIDFVEDELALEYLVAAKNNSGAIGLNLAYQKLKESYLEEMDMDLPSCIKEKFLELSS